MSLEGLSTVHDNHVEELLGSIARQLHRWTVAAPTLMVFGAIIVFAASGLPGVVFGVLVASLPFGIVMFCYTLLLRRLLPYARAAVAVGGRPGEVTAEAVTGYYGAKQMRLEIRVDQNTLRLVPIWRTPRQWTCSGAPATVYGGRLSGDPIIVACADGAACAVLGSRSGWVSRR